MIAEGEVPHELDRGTGLLGEQLRRCLPLVVICEIKENAGHLSFQLFHASRGSCFAGPKIVDREAV